MMNVCFPTIFVTFEGLKVGRTPGLSDDPRVGGPVEMLVGGGFGGGVGGGGTDAGVGQVGGEGTGSAGVWENGVTGCKDTKWLYYLKDKSLAWPPKGSPVKV